MKHTRFFGVAVPGTSPRSNSPMPALHKVAGLLLAFFLLQCSVSRLSAQTPTIHWTDLDSFQVGYAVHSASSTIAANEQFTVKLHLQTVGSFECLGAHFHLDLDNGVAVETSSPVSLPVSSWLGSASELDAECNTGSGAYDASVSVSRGDSLERSGNGHVVTLHLQNGASPLAAAEAVTSLDGGIIVVDNLDFKRSPVAVESKWSVFPNPFSERVVLQGDAGDKAKLEVLDGNGNVILRRDAQASQELNLHYLSPGVYWLRIVSEDGPSETFKLLKL